MGKSSIPVGINGSSRSQAVSLPLRTLLRDEQSEYHRQGFLHIPSLTSPHEIAVVRGVIDLLYARKGLEFGSIGSPLQLAPELEDTALFRSCRAIAKQLLGRSAMFGCDRALYKEPRGLYGSPWHQDAAFHGRYGLNNTLGFWIPLHDVQAENGCMQYITLEPEQILLPHRPFYPQDSSSLMTDCADIRRAVTVPVRAGGATIHGPLTVHAAHVNSADVTRRVWTLTFRPWGRWGGIAPARIVHVARVVSSDIVSHTLQAVRLRLK